MVAIFGMFFQSGLNGTLLRSFAAALVRERAGREGAVLMVAIIGVFFFQDGLTGTLLRSFAAALVRGRAGREGAVLMVAIFGVFFQEGWIVA